MTLSLRWADQQDLEFCAALNRGNMAPYRAARRIEWNPFIYRKSWSAFENGVVLLGNMRVGVLRLRAEGGLLEIRDLQVVAGHQRKGVGAWAIGEARRLARARGFDGLALRVYAENPAVRLYEREGFTVVADIDGTLHMQLRI